MSLLLLFPSRPITTGGKAPSGGSASHPAPKGSASHPKPGG